MLTTAGVQYSLANLLVTRNPESITSWKDHFESIRTRFFGIAALWIDGMTLF